MIRPPLPEGPYMFEIEDAELSRSTNDRPLWILRCRLVGTDRLETKFFADAPHAVWVWKPIAEKFPDIPEMLIGRRFIIDVHLATVEDLRGKRNVLGDFIAEVLP